MIRRDLPSCGHGEVRIMADRQLLDGRVAVVTGAASGMGRVMACALAGAGARVAGVSKSADCQCAVEDAVNTFGALDILINCAGISMSAAAPHQEARIKFYEADPDGWQRIFTINGIGAFLMTRFAVAPMIERGW